MVLIKAVEAFENDGGSPEFCYKMGLRYKAMVEMRKLRKQLTNNINVLLSREKEIPLNPKLQRPKDEQTVLLRQIVLSGCPDRIARRVEPEEATGSESQAKLRHAYRSVSFYSKIVYVVTSYYVAILTVILQLVGVGN